MELYSDIDKYVYACDDVTYHIEPTDSESTIYIVHESDSDCQKFLKEHDMTAGDRYLGNRKPAPFNKCFAHISNSSDPKVHMLQNSTFDRSSKISGTSKFVF